MNKEKKTQYDRKYRRNHKEEIVQCNRKYYQVHKEELDQKHRKYCQDHEEKIREYKHEYFQKHKKEIRKHRCEYRKNHRKEISLQNQRYYQKARDFVLIHYGNKCVCCNEDHKEFLNIDHINGDGKKHRKEVGNGIAFYKWIINNKFPNDLRILCYKCNRIMWQHGICLHQRPGVDPRRMF